MQRTTLPARAHLLRRTFDRRAALGRMVATILVTGALATIATPAAAQAWPSKPIRLVIPYAAGGPTDVIGRALATRVSAKLGQPVVVDNRAGAGGVIGVDAVAKSAPDGYTFALVAPGPVAGMPALSKVPYAPADIQYVTLVAKNPSVIAVNAKSGYATLADLVKAAKASPGKLNYSSAGNATTPHIGAELFRQEAGIDVVHVPYKGAAPAVTALLAGEVQFTQADLMVILPHAQSGALRVLAVAGAQRVSQIPATPTTAEAGLPAAVMETWYGVIGPRGLPADVQAKMRDTLVEVVKSADMTALLAQQGAVAVTSSGDEYRDLMAAEQEKWRKVAARGGIRMD
jgi:tripartite-type tricarboxylate transporter receptor subunit TctC